MKNMKIKCMWFDHRRNQMRYDLVTEIYPDGSIGCELDSEHCSEPMLSIGLKDKNGIEIFEGDLFNDDCHVYLIYWNKNACGFKIKTIGGGKMIHPKYNNIEGVIKNLNVTNNIYENKDLLTLNN